jgi:hypothetical protein
MGRYPIPYPIIPDITRFGLEKSEDSPTIQKKGVVRNLNGNILIKTASYTEALAMGPNTENFP